MLIDVSRNSTYIKVKSMDTPQGTLTAWHCPETDNPAWDKFLNTTAFGHFYQSSVWAQVRTIDGWQPLITIVTLNDQLIGGFQILLRSKSYLGKIGLLLKGPIVDSDDPMIISFVISILKKTAQSYKIRALIGQPPDNDKKIHSMLMKSDFSPNQLEHAIKNNTLVIDLQKNLDEIFSAIRKSRRTNINKAIRTGVSVSEGDRNDLSTFFHYMLETCKRQQVSPSPSSENFLTQMWDIFSRNGNIKLFFSEFAGKYISANLVVLFGNTAYLWKFGWSGNLANNHPNEMLNWEIIKWAKANGFSYADMGAIDTKLADILWHGETITGEFLNSYSYFKVSFGGEVLQLQTGYTYIYNPFLRWAYNFFVPYINAQPSLKKRIMF